MNKVFCPHCGNKTLKKVSVTVNEDGGMKMHFSRNPKVLNARGLRVREARTQTQTHTGRSVSPWCHVIAERLQVFPKGLNATQVPVEILAVMVSCKPETLKLLEVRRGALIEASSSINWDV